MGAQHLDIYFTSDIHGYIYPTNYRSQQEEDIGLFKCANHFHKTETASSLTGGIFYKVLHSEHIVMIPWRLPAHLQKL